MKKAEGVVKLVVCNPNENKEQKEKEKAKSQELKDDSSTLVAQKTPQKSGASGEFNSAIKFLRFVSVGKSRGI